MPLVPLYLTYTSLDCTLHLAAGEGAASVPRLRRAWRLCVRGAVFAAPAVVPGSGAVLLAEMDGVLHAFSVHGERLCAARSCAHLLK